MQNKRKQFLDSLKFEQIDSRHSNIKAAHAATCKWLINNPEYLAWVDFQKLSEHHGFLWLSGKPGAGKSTIMKYVYTRAKRTLRGGDAAISFFFNARGVYLERSTTGMYRSLLFQLLERFPDLQEICDNSRLSQSSGSCPTSDIIQTLFREAIAKLGRRSLTCFIDAVDECDKQQVRDMVEYFEELGQQAVKDETELRICFSSRHYPYVSIRNGLRLTIEGQTGHENDLEKYVQSCLRARSSPLVSEVQAEILRKAAGVFMWVVLVVDILNKEFDQGRMFAVKKRLKEIPDKLSDLFRDILRRDNENMESLRLCLQWILFAKRPLRREEFYFAVSAGLLDEDEDPNDSLTATISNQDMDQFVISSSKGLAETIKSKNPTVQFIHESVRDFLIKDNGLQELWPELDSNFGSQSHDKLKQCCHIYLQLDVSEIPSIKEALPKHRFDYEILKEKASQKFPFLQYATQHILHHSNIAASNMSQDDFLAQFMLDDWIIFHNLFEKYKVRRYTPTANLFYILADKGHSALIQARLRHDSSSYILGERYHYPLFTALINGHDDCVQALLEQDTGREGTKEGLEYIKDLPIYRDRTPLRWAVSNNHAPVMKLLLERGAAINIEDERSEEALQIALQNGYDAIVRLLVNKGIDKAALNRAFWKAADEGHEALVKRYLEHGADINTMNDSKRTALFAASERGNEAVAKFLIEHGADIHTKDKDGQTALWIASQQGYRAIVKLLIENGADIHTKNKDGQTALWAASFNGNEAIGKLLIENGAV